MRLKGQQHALVYTSSPPLLEHTPFKRRRDALLKRVSVLLLLLLLLRVGVLLLLLLLPVLLLLLLRNLQKKKKGLNVSVPVPLH